MKKRTGIVAAVTALMLSNLLFLGAQAGAQQEPERRFGIQRAPFGAEGGSFAGFGAGAHFPGLMLGALDLSDAQKEQIKSLMSANRAATEPYRNQLRDSAKAMRDATANGQFDETQVRAIAQAQAQANVELMVAGEKTKAEIFKVLTPEQRAKLEERQARVGSRIGERRKPAAQ